MISAARQENVSDAVILSNAKMLGSVEIPLAPMLPNLLDIYGVGIQKKLEF